MRVDQRALGKADQTRTWNLLTYVVAQSDHFKPNATSLQKQIEVVNE